MNKENIIRSAAKSRRSAVVERIKIREEWLALKEIDSQVPAQKPRKVIPKKFVINFKSNKHKEGPGKDLSNKNTTVCARSQSPSEVLCGTVVLVDVGSESRALALRAALTALGASVVPKWSPLVTHLVWSQGGCRDTRAKARALATALVSPLWVEACAASNKRLPERTFPAVARPSDIPSPRTLRQMLKKADMENLALDLSNSKEEEIMQKLRLSSDHDTSADTTSEQTTNTSLEKSVEKPVSKTNTAPRRKSLIPSNEPPKKSRRKLYTAKEPDLTRKSSTDSEDLTIHPRLTQRDKHELAQAGRITRKLLKACNVSTLHTSQSKLDVFRIVLTGMNRSERIAVTEAIRSLKGRIMKEVTKHTTHVLLGSCRQETDTPNPSQLQNGDVQQARTLNALCGAAMGCYVLTAQWALDSAKQTKWLPHQAYVVPQLKKISQRARVERIALRYNHTNYAYNVFHGMTVYVSPNTEQRDAALQLLSLCGATVQDGGPKPDGCATQGPNVTTRTTCGGASQRSRILRVASQYIHGTQFGQRSAGFDLIIGTDVGTVSSKWVFDSVATGRMRTTRRYINKDDLCEKFIENFSQMSS